MRQRCLPCIRPTWQFVLYQDNDTTLCILTFHSTQTYFLTFSKFFVHLSLCCFLSAEAILMFRFKRCIEHTVGQSIRNTYKHINHRQLKLVDFGSSAQTLPRHVMLLYYKRTIHVTSYTCVQYIIFDEDILIRHSLLFLSLYADAHLLLFHTK